MSISLFDLVIVLAFVCIFSSIYFPVYFKFGGIKANQFIVRVLLLFSGLPLVAFANGNYNLLQRLYYAIISMTSISIDYLALIVGLIMFLISLMISIGIYNNKEF